ncbi:hypothetical protein SAMN04487895_11483 [Paenibacillus sophorae]|uniref:Uncharacterized protein n=1 Tax=Paenibacillus sophorae TaxID=1333845 RepID=A0A1H8TIJ8_9BACL|nr:hypothetical protein [Paenibacillus sophorae]QWU16241.1 hypothetical protein KP014_02920 [Paenibacillus sophorae]SEO90940.1 hypothetical protein SAMN04487895_11483 [Paenibacillus sophorae]
MIIIQSQEDLAELSRDVFPQTLHRFISELLEGLQAEAEPGEELEHLLSHPLILCEPGDDIRSLLRTSSLGMEFVENIGTPDVPAFRAGVLLDNDWLAQYVIPASTLDDDTLTWLGEITSGGFPQ